MTVWRLNRLRALVFLGALFMCASCSGPGSPQEGAGPAGAVLHESGSEGQATEGQAADGQALKDLKAAAALAAGGAAPLRRQTSRGAVKEASRAPAAAPSNLKRQPLPAEGWISAPPTAVNGGTALQKKWAQYMDEAFQNDRKTFLFDWYAMDSIDDLLGRDHPLTVENLSSYFSRSASRTARSADGAGQIRIKEINGEKALIIDSSYAHNLQKGGWAAEQAISQADRIAIVSFPDIINALAKKELAGAGAASIQAEIDLFHSALKSIQARLKKGASLHIMGTCDFLCPYTAVFAKEIYIEPTGEILFDSNFLEVALESRHLKSSIAGAVKEGIPSALNDQLQQRHMKAAQKQLQRIAEFWPKASRGPLSAPRQLEEQFYNFLGAGLSQKIKSYAAGLRPEAAPSLFEGIVNGDSRALNAFSGALTDMLSPLERSQAAMALFSTMSYFNPYTARIGLLSDFLAEVKESALRHIEEERGAEYAIKFQKALQHSNDQTEGKAKKISRFLDGPPLYEADNGGGAYRYVSPTASALEEIGYGEVVIGQNSGFQNFTVPLYKDAPPAVLSLKKLP